MTKKELIKALVDYDDNEIIIITDGKSWCNIEKIERSEVVWGAVGIFEEKYPIFSDK